MHVPNLQDFYPIRRRGRFFEVWQLGDRLIEEEDEQPDKLVCLCVYKKGAEEVQRRLAGRVHVALKPDVLIAAEPQSPRT